MVEERTDADTNKGFQQQVNRQWFCDLPTDRQQDVIDEAAKKAPQEEIKAANRKVQGR